MGAITKLIEALIGTPAERAAAKGAAAETVGPATRVDAELKATGETVEGAAPKVDPAQTPTAAAGEASPPAGTAAPVERDFLVTTPEGPRAKLLDTPPGVDAADITTRNLERTDDEALSPAFQAFGGRRDVIDLRQIQGGFNIAKIDAEGDVGSFINTLTRDNADAFNSYRRGRQKLSDIAARAEARALGMTIKDTLALRALKGEEMNAAGFVMLRQAEAIKTKLKDGGPNGENLSDADIVTIRLMMEDMNLVAMHVRGLETETARTLASLRNMKKAVGDGTAQLGEVVRSYGGTLHNKRIMALMSQIEDPIKLVAAVRDARKVRGSDMFWEFYYNVSMLSNPQTHIVNFGSGAAAYVTEGAELWLGYIGNVTRRALRLGDPENKIFAREVLAFTADVSTIRQAAADAWRAMKSGQGEGNVSKLEGQQRGPATTAENVRQLNPTIGKLIPEGSRAEDVFDFLADFGIRGSQRIMLGADEFVKGLVYQSHLRRVATHTAIEDGLTGQAFNDRVATLLSNPKVYMPEAVQTAVERARELTFQSELGAKGQALQRMVTSDPAFVRKNAAGELEPDHFSNTIASIAQAPIRMTLPFIRTPINLFKYTVRHTPLAVATGTFWSAVRSGGPAGQRAWSQMALGSALGYGFLTMAQNGLITGGGPTNFSARRALENAGFQQYSFIVPKDSAAGRVLGLEKDQTISYRRFDPLSQIMGISSDMSDIWHFADPEEQGELAAALSVSIYRNLTSRTWMQGFARLEDAITASGNGRLDPITRFAAHMAATPASPAGVAWLTQTFDETGPVMRDTRSAAAAESAVDKIDPNRRGIDKVTADVHGFMQEIINRVKSRMPEFNEDLPPRLSFFGEERSRGTGFALNLLPFYRKDLKIDLTRLDFVNGNIARLSGFPALRMTDKQWTRFINMPGGGGVEAEFIRLSYEPSRHPQSIRGVRLTPQEHHDYVKLVNSIEPEFSTTLVSGDNDIDIPAGINLREAMTELFLSDGYRIASEFDDTPGSKQKLISQLVSHYRHRANPGFEDDDIPLGGADEMLREAHPRFGSRLLKLNAFREQRIGAQ